MLVLLTSAITCCDIAMSVASLSCEPEPDEPHGLTGPPCTAGTQHRASQKDMYVRQSTALLQQIANHQKHEDHQGEQPYETGTKPSANCQCSLAGWWPWWQWRRAALVTPDTYSGLDL